MSSPWLSLARKGPQPQSNKSAHVRIHVVFSCSQCSCFRKVLRDWGLGHTLGQATRKRKAPKPVDGIEKPPSSDVRISQHFFQHLLKFPHAWFSPRPGEQRRRYFEFQTIGPILCFRCFPLAENGKEFCLHIFSQMPNICSYRSWRWEVNDLRLVIRVCA